MKDSKEYSPKIHKLYRSLKRRYPKVRHVLYDEPTDALVYAVISEGISEKASQSTIKKFTECFVDWNDLRVSLTEEIVETLGADTAAIRDTASRLAGALRALFNKYHMVSLEALKKIGKRPARTVLEEIDGTSRFVVNYCVLTSLGGHAIPLTKKMVEYLRSNELVHPEADEQEIEGFLTRQITAENAYEFYVLLRRHSESSVAGTKKKTTPKAKKKTKKVKKKKA